MPEPADIAALAVQHGISVADRDLFLLPVTDDPERAALVAEQLGGLLNEPPRLANYVPREGANLPPPQPDETVTGLLDRLFDRYPGTPPS